MELRELSVTRLEDRLDLVFGLLRDGNHAIQVLVHEQTHEHLSQKYTIQVLLPVRKAVDRFIRICESGKYETSVCECTVM